MARFATSATAHSLSPDRENQEKDILSRTIFPESDGAAPLPNDDYSGWILPARTTTFPSLMTWRTGLTPSR